MKNIKESNALKGLYLGGHIALGINEVPVFIVLITPLLVAVFFEYFFGTKLKLEKQLELGPVKLFFFTLIWFQAISLAFYYLGTLYNL